MFYAAILYIQYNTVTLAKEKKAQNNPCKTGHAYEMQVAFEILRFRFCLIKLTIRKIILHVHEVGVIVIHNSSYYSSEKYLL